MKEAHCSFLQASVKESEERLNVTRKALADAQSLRVQVLIPRSTVTGLVIYFPNYVYRSWNLQRLLQWRLKSSLSYFQEKARADELEQINQKKISDLEKEVCSGFYFIDSRQIRLLYAYVEKDTNFYLDFCSAYFDGLEEYMESKFP